MNDMNYNFITANQLGANATKQHRFLITVKERINSKKELMPNNYKYGAVQMYNSRFVKNVIGNLFTGLGAIKAYDWGDRWLIEFEEKSIIGGKRYFITKSEFDKLERVK